MFSDHERASVHFINPIDRIALAAEQPKAIQQIVVANTYANVSE
jgi:hypothetical protein